MFVPVHQSAGSSFQKICLRKVFDFLRTINNNGTQKGLGAGLLPDEGVEGAEGHHAYRSVQGRAFTQGARGDAG